MFRNLYLPVCSLALAISASAAFGQTYGPPARFNPFGSLTGPAGRHLTQYYNNTIASGSSSASLNQMALRNAQALMMNSLQRPSATSSAGRIGLGFDTSYSGSKPFSGYQRGPTVSPYLNLFRVDLSGNNALNYNTLVEPQLRQQQLNQQLQRQELQNARRLQAIAAQPAFNPQGSREEFPTGHQTVFQYTGRYYPQARIQQKRR